MKEPLVQQTPTSNGVKIRLAVEKEGASVAAGDLSIGFLKVGRAPHRVAVTVASGDGMAIGPLEIARAIQKLGKAVMGLGESWLPVEQGKIGRPGGLRILDFKPPGGEEIALKRQALRAGCLW